MILIITHKEDFTVDYVVDKLNHRKIDYLRFNCEDIDFLGYDYSTNFDKLQLQLANHNNFKSVWFRRTKLPAIDIEDSGTKAFILSEYDALLNNILGVIESPKWLSKPNEVYNAENKFLQLSTARKLGFKIPNTLITNSREKIKNFYEENNGDIIIKPLSTSRIIHANGIEHIFTNKVLSNDINNIGDFDITPAIFQKNIDKKRELRITVVNDEVFSAYVDSQVQVETSIDWRKKRLQFHQAKIPEYLAKMCLKLVKSLNLSFGAIDLIQTNQDEYFFLEINPNGQWAWIEFDTNLQISEEIIRYLCDK